jgi:glutathione S-transferase
LLTLYHGWKSSASRRVRLCLAEKGLKYESRLIDLTKGEHHSPEYLARNPNGVIPLLILADGRSLYESSTINEYLDETWPDPPLRPADPYLRAEMRNWVRYVDERIGNLIVFNWKHGIAQVASKLSDAELAERIRKIPRKERQ